MIFFLSLKYLSNFKSTTYFSNNIFAHCSVHHQLFPSRVKQTTAPFLPFLLNKTLLALPLLIRMNYCLNFTTDITGDFVIDWKCLYRLYWRLDCCIKKAENTLLCGTIDPWQGSTLLYLDEVIWLMLFFQIALLNPNNFLYHLNH